MILPVKGSTSIILALTPIPFVSDIQSVGFFNKFIGWLVLITYFMSGVFF